MDIKWKQFIQKEKKKEYYLSLSRKLKEEYETQTIYPPYTQVFEAFKLTPLDSIKVVIVGQDVYPTKGNAMGLAFSVNPDIKIPASLKNIFKEIQSEFGTEYPNNGNLTRWATQGVFLLNTVLTVREGKPNSHKGIGWEIFTDNVIKLLNDHPSPKVFMLWGANAISKEKCINTQNNLVLKSAHPSPLSAYRGFFGNNHFIKANEFLESKGLTPIIW